jgi:hypothetical protein
MSELVVVSFPDPFKADEVLERARPAAETAASARTGTPTPSAAGPGQG